MTRQSAPPHIDCHIINRTAPVAQMDRAIASGAIGREFESLRAHQIFPLPITGLRLRTHFPGC